MTPYDDGIEQLRAELRRLDLLLHRYLRDRSVGEGGDGGEFSGLFVSDDEVQRLLTVPTHDGASASEMQQSTDGSGASGASTMRHAGGATGGRPHPGGESVLDDRYEEHLEACQQRERETLAAGTSLPLASLVETFDLTAVDRDALLLAIAPAVDEKYEKIYGYLQDDITRIRPTVGLLCRVLAAGETERLTLRRRFATESALFDHRLVTAAGEPGTPLLSRSVFVEEAVVAWLLGEDDLAGELDGCATLVTPSQPLAALAVRDEIRDRVGALAARGGAADARPLWGVFHGPYGASMTRAVNALATRFDAPVLRVSAADIVGEAGTATVERICRDASLHEAVVHVTDVQTLVETGEDGSETQYLEELPGLVRALDSFEGHVFASGTEPIPGSVQRRVERHEVALLAFEVPSYEQRRAIWRSFDVLGDVIEPSTIASTFRLTRGQIHDAVAAAQTASGQQTPTRDAVYEACRAQSREQLEDLATPVEPTYDFDDIVLPSDVEAHLQEIAAHVTRRAQVFAEWGFASKFSLGNGLNVLFAGPSGTGKTMAAEVIANHAGLDLYKIDLSSVVSKYVGETESNLRRVFDEAANTNAVLFFDEADALFGERSSVSDAQDRYANVEVSYLLQRMEEHDGTTILATNIKGNLDDAFERRINATLEFPLPDRESRDAIWRGIFPAETPVGDLDFGFLADFEIVGGKIKNAALTAAFLAAEEDTPVEMRHVVRALYRELEKAGKLVNADQFGEYAHLLEEFDR